MDLGQGRGACGPILGCLNEKFQGFANKSAKSYDSVHSELFEACRIRGQPRETGRVATERPRHPRSRGPWHPPPPWDLPFEYGEMGGHYPWNVLVFFPRAYVIQASVSDELHAAALFHLN